MTRASDPLDWAWTLKIRLLGGTPTRELFEQALAEGERGVPFLVDILSRRELRESGASDLEALPLVAMRVLARLRAESAIPALMNVLLDPVDIETFGEEAGIALARIGTSSLAPLEGVLKDRERPQWHRTSAARALTFACLHDRRCRPRVRAAFERLLLDPRESDRMLNAHVVLDACTLAMLVLLPAIEVAYRAGRVEDDVIDLDAARLDLSSRHQRPDRDQKELVRRDVCAEYLTLAETLEDMDEPEREWLRSSLERIDREGAGEPTAADLDDLYSERP